MKLEAFDYFLPTKSEETIDLYLAFDRLLHPDDYRGERKIPYLLEKNYCLSLPCPMVAPWVYSEFSDMAAYLEMDREIFDEVCHNRRAMLPFSHELFADLQKSTPTNDPAPTPYVVRWRDQLLVRGAHRKGARALEILQQALEETPFCELLAVSAVRLTDAAARAILTKDAFLNGTALHEAYLRLAIRATRVTKVARHKAPMIIIENEKALLQKAITELCGAISDTLS